MLSIFSTILIAFSASQPGVLSQIVVPEPQTLSSRTMSMTNRYPSANVNNIFRDNILLAFSYMEGEVTDKSQINWDAVNSDDHYEFTLQPGEQFAFHDRLSKKYATNVVKTTNAYFGYAQGFKDDGWIVGDGVCHFASIIYWAAKDAGLNAIAPVNHDFRAIPDVPKEYGVSINTMPGKAEMQNLYITNNFDKPVTLVFDYKNSELTVSVKS